MESVGCLPQLKYLPLPFDLKRDHEVPAVLISEYFLELNLVLKFSLKLMDLLPNHNITG